MKAFFPFFIFLSKFLNVPLALGFCAGSLVVFASMAQAHHQEEEDIILSAPAGSEIEKAPFSAVPSRQPSPAPHYPSNEKYAGKKMVEAGKIKGYVSDVSHSRGMVEKKMNPQEADKFAPKSSILEVFSPEVTSAELMNDASDLAVKDAVTGKVPEVAPLPPRPLKRSNPAGERKFQIWFSLTKGQRELRDFIYPLIPSFLKACPTWESQLSSWTHCHNAIPDQEKFIKKLTLESKDLQIQQWFFLNEMADIGASEDDILRAQTFIARYFSEMVEDQLQKEGWCYGPSWVPVSEQAWMKCSKMPLRSARSDAGWGRYRRPANAPKPLWPMPANH